MTSLRYLVPVLALALAVRSAAAQEPGAELTQVLVSRAALTDLALRLEQAAASGNFTGEARARARAQAELVRARLRNGDFQPGDRIMLRVEGESALSDTFTVRGGRTVLLPVIGEIPLVGVLRVELTDSLASRLAQFVRNPQVRAQALIRIAVTGAVQNQGYFTVPVDIPVNDVLTTAVIGGNANLDAFRIERSGEIVYQGEELQRMVTEGRTLDAMSIQAGDRFVLPERTTRNPLQSLQTMQILLTIPISILGLIQVIRN